MLSINDSVSKLHLVKPEHLEALSKLGIKTVKDLLYHFPRDWQDLSEIKKISEIRPGEKISIKARVKHLSIPGFPFRRVKITEALLEDETGNVVAIWFNQPYIKNSLRLGNEYYFSGKGQIYATKKQQTLQLTHPTFEMVREETIHVAGLIPDYPLTEGITQKQVRYWLKQALESLPQLIEILPEKLKKKMKLIGHTEAIKNLHFPDDAAHLKKAKNRLAFEELFLFQLAFQSYKKTLKCLPAPAIQFDKNLVSQFVEKLSFQLTASQRLSAWEILSDMAKPHPMNRLLEGEVGSGKTVVAGLAMLETATAGYQSILLAPTEILAWQHYQTLEKLFAHTGIKIALQTRSHKIGEIREIREGTIKIIAGTHALLQERISFHKIGLLVIDEQHRFGIKQRQALLRGQAELVPHLLSMTATPIPRTLALAFYGDLDISKLKELPSGRKKVITKLASPENRVLAYEVVRKELQRGRQAYVIVPLVGETSDLSPLPNPPPQGEGNTNETKSVITEVEKLKKIFPEFQIGLLHGKMPGEEKKKIMQVFSAKGGSATGGKAHKIDILVSTTVVEVGVDVPNATIMIIENAERFGLSQLHQLRGRVGRSHLQSLCVLFAGLYSETTRQRLEAVVNSNDGFELAEIDLKMRGAGEILGTKQSGFIPFKIASLSDEKTIESAKKEALALLEQDPELENYPMLMKKVAEISKEAHLE
ncbi:MAG: ATP-dependent DNA helicase RecG [Candidatus Doudnabacteria bacterium RIFCSPHIGHO2_01_FULL_46_14]|uniref:ATP-dependent DNA helicase RecG n=1 Tax=Candidatus Doudnabacteria bacterium RIFCSPHIGHO2_01_FULL_46_14 TaxID=1817824 RepID=A0A1F5NNB8_9BACT|nr:MAG: ATP-dependent DNA helicase RecG [Candidatus Doudnabacteria bacterium RIFCSPHIGHO2_01_FULL_46_14]